jgi:hypothetical protein
MFDADSDLPRLPKWKDNVMSQPSTQSPSDRPSAPPEQASYSSAGKGKIRAGSRQLPAAPRSGDRFQHTNKGAEMSENVHRYFMYHYPALPGGGATVGAIFLILLVLFMLYRHTKWSGWLAFFFSVGFYTIPLLTEYHKH